VVVRNKRNSCCLERLGTMIFSRRAKAAGEDQIKSRFVFSMPIGRKNRQKRSLFRDPVALDIFRRVAKGLSEDGFKVTEAKPGKACVAAFSIRFPTLEVTAVLDASWRGENIQCRIWTHCYVPFWRKLSPELVSQNWICACTAIEKVLTEKLGVESFQQLRTKEG
jgi:hypothetical protein